MFVIHRIWVSAAGVLSFFLAGPCLWAAGSFVAEDGVQASQATLNPWLQLAKRAATDGAAMNNFGYSVAVSGNTAVVGTPYATIGSNQSQGVVYIFVKPSTGWQNMTQVAKLTASDGAAFGYFGYSVSISGNTVAVGAPNAAGKGAVYVFVKSASGWSSMTQTAKLTASDSVIGDNMGYSVSLSGATVVAGAPFKTPGSIVQQGAAYVFVRPSTGWTDMTQTAEVTTSDGAPLDNFGLAVAISGKTIVGGSPKGQTGIVGAAYVFVEPPSGWTNMTQTAKLTASDGSFDNLFGVALAASGSTVVVGAPNTAHGGDTYVFVQPPGGWTNMTETAQLNIPNGAPPASLGWSVAVSGNTVVAGALAAPVAGGAYVFVKPALGWTNMFPTATLTAADGIAGDTLGYSVAVSGSTVLTGAPKAAFGGNLQQGAAYVFGRVSITSFSPTDGPAGTEVAIVGTNLGAASAVAFGGVRATTFTVNSDTQVTATVPNGAVSGRISVKIPTGSTTSAGTFTVTQ